MNLNYDYFYFHYFRDSNNNDNDNSITNYNKYNIGDNSNNKEYKILIVGIIKRAIVIK